MTQNKISLGKSLVVSINDDCEKGHGADIRVSLNRALTNIPYSIFQDRQKKPEHIFSATVEEILLCDGVLLDALSSSTHTPDILIQFGISYALGKKIMFLVVRHNSQSLSPITSKVIGNYDISFDYYLDLITTLKPKTSKWLRANIKPKKIERNEVPVHSFSVFGVNQETKPDLHQTISSFPISTDWKAKFYRELGFTSPLKDLSTAIGMRSFCIFCLDENSNENLYLGIGIAIGLGVPFLILKPDDVTIPESLGGYDGIIKFGNQNQLKRNLKKYSKVFLSEKVRSWDGGTFFHLLSRIEKQIETIDDVSKLNRIENLLHAINRSIRPALTKPYILLGDVCRERVHKCYPQSIDYQQSVELLTTAINYYQSALEIQPNIKRCEDNIVAVDRHIQLIELLRESKYRSIPHLIRLIGEDLTTDEYLYLREFLLVEVEKLIDELDHLNALALLAAIYLHDKSDRIMELIERVLVVAPKVFLDTIQDVQEHAITLENNIAKLNDLLADRNKQIDDLSNRLKIKSENLSEAKDKISDLEKELGGILSQLSTVKTMNERLNALATQGNTLKEEIEAARGISGRGVLVNFGYGLGWAMYDALYGERPYIIRDGNVIYARNGLVLKNNDEVFHSDGTNSVWLIPPEAEIRLPMSD